MFLFLSKKLNFSFGLLLVVLLIPFLSSRNNGEVAGITITHPKFGVVVDDYANKFGGLSSVVSMLGKPISTVSIFKQFGSSNNLLNLDDLAYIKSQNLKLQLAWEPWNPAEGLNQSIDYLAQIPTGSLDNYLKSFAQEVKAYGGPVVLRFGHEMNGNWYPWGQRPKEYVAAYRYIVKLFKSEGVSNVSWMWSINSSPLSGISGYYPGKDVVDVIGLDGYNWGTTQNFGGWVSFRNIFSQAYKSVLAYKKPIVISETASTEEGGSKADWIKNMFLTELSTYFPKVTEVIWFDLLKETDWRINSSESSLKAFQTYLH